MKEDLEQEQRIEEPIQTFAGPPGAPGETSTNFQINPTIDINTFPGGKEAFYSRPGVGYNTGGASMIGHYANFTDGDTGFLIYSENASPTSFHICKKSKKDTKWGTRYTLYHSGNLDSLATKTNLDAKADISYVNSKIDQSYVDAGISTLESRLNTMVSKSTLPRLHCAGYVSSKGDIQCNGRDLECSHISTGKYIITPKTGELPRLYIVNITLDSTNPVNLSATLSNGGLNEFTVNIGKSSMFDCGFHFLMVEY